MSYSGTRSAGGNVVSSIPVSGTQSTSAVTANQVLQEVTVAHYGRIGGIAFNADTAGTGAGNTVLDVLKNGTSIYATSGSKPTLAATSTGGFANTQPGTRGVKPGDVIKVIVSSVSTTGHSGISGQICIEGA
jgi:hypothetical protein